MAANELDKLLLMADIVNQANIEPATQTALLAALFHGYSKDLQEMDLRFQTLPSGAFNTKDAAYLRFLCTSLCGQLYGGGGGKAASGGAGGGGPEGQKAGGAQGQKKGTSSLSTSSPSRRPTINARKPIRPIDFIHEPYMSLPASTHPLEAQKLPFSLFQANVYFDLSLTRDEKAHLLNDTYHALASALPPFDFCADTPITLDKIQKVLLREDFQCRQPLSNGSKHFWEELFDYSPTDPTAPLSPLEERERLQSELAYYLSLQLVDAGFQITEAYTQGHAVILGILRNFEVPFAINSLPKFAFWVTENISAGQFKLYCEIARSAKTKRATRDKKADRIFNQDIEDFYACTEALFPWLKEQCEQGAMGHSKPPQNALEMEITDSGKAEINTEDAGIFLYKLSEQPRYLAQSPLDRRDLHQLFEERRIELDKPMKTDFGKTYRSMIEWLVSLAERHARELELAAQAEEEEKEKKKKERREGIRKELAWLYADEEENLQGDGWEEGEEEEEEEEEEEGEKEDEMEEEKKKEQEEEVASTAAIREQTCGLVLEEVAGGGEDMAVAAAQLVTVQEKDGDTAGGSDTNAGNRLACITTERDTNEQKGGEEALCASWQLLPPRSLKHDTSSAG